VCGAFRLSADEIRRVNAGGMNPTEFWYPRLTVVVVALGLFAVGLRAALRQRRALWVLAVVAVVLVALSLGRWSTWSAWAWQHVPPLSSWRFPERLWRPALVCGLPLVALGLHQLAVARGARVAGVVGGLGVVELLAQTPAPLLAEPWEAPPEFAALRSAAATHDVRIGVDRRTDRARPEPRFDTRALGLPMVRPPDSSGSPILKYLPLEDLPNHRSLQWLGIRHLIVPLPTDGAVDARFGLRDDTNPLGDTGYGLRSVVASGPRLGLLWPRARPGVPFDRALTNDPPTTTPDGAVPLAVPRVDRRRRARERAGRWRRPRRRPAAPAGWRADDGGPAAPAAAGAGRRRRRRRR